MRRGPAHNISAALLVLVGFIIIDASTKRSPSSQAVHRLDAALRGALLEGIGVWAAVPIMGNVCADGVGPAPPVLVILVIMEAGAIGAPLSDAIHRLAAIVHTAIHKTIEMRTVLTS